MSNINLALNNVKRQIPLQVLNAAFIPSQHYGGFHLQPSLDSLIRKDVIDGRVIVDCNLVGGTQTVIPLQSANTEYVDQFNLIVRIPKSLTNGRSIAFPLNLSLFNYNNQYTSSNSFANNAQSPLLNAAKGVMSSFLPTPAVSTAYVSLIDDNVVLVRGSGYTIATCALLCVLENEADMANLQSTTLHNFFKLVELAVKSHIYNTLIVQMDSASIQGGFALGALKNIVESYADAETMYQEFLDQTWRRVALMNDPEARVRNLRMLTGGQN